VLRVVIDTNVFISGIIQKSGNPYRVVRFWEEGMLSLLTTLPLIEEVKKVLNYPRIKKKYALDEETIKYVVLNLLKYSVVVEDPPTLAVIKDDPEDNKVLSAAVGGKAEYVVTGDSHLLNLADYEGIKIISPREFFENIGPLIRKE